MVTAHTAAPNIHTAGFVRRALAAALDAVPALTLWWGTTVNLASGRYETIPVSRWNLLDRLVDVINSSPGLIGWPIIWCCLASVIWHTVTVAMFGTSPGKKIVGLTVVAPHGGPPGPLRALLHALLRPATSACLAIGPLWAFADPQRRTLYDRICGIYVAMGEPAVSPVNRRR